jgi:hypothetical protein
VPIRLEDPIVAAALITGMSAVAVAIVNGLSRPSARGCRTGRRSRRPTRLGGSSARSATGHRSWLDHHHRMMWPRGRLAGTRYPVPACLRYGREEDRGEGPDTRISIRRSQPTGGR